MPKSDRDAKLFDGLSKPGATSVARGKVAAVLKGVGVKRIIRGWNR